MRLIEMGNGRDVIVGTSRREFGRDGVERAIMR